MKKIFSFLGSYVVAIILMIVLGVVLAVGTVYESRVSAEVAQQLIYKSYWFISLLGLLFLNLLLSTFKRWPFQKHHTGFVITHLGLLALIAGTMVSKIWGIEGQLALAEGQTSSSFQTKIESLSVSEESLTRIFEKRFSNWTNSFPWKKHLAFHNTELLVDGFMENSVMEESYTTGSEKRNPVIHFHIANSATSVDHWLELKNKSLNHVNLGPITVRFEKLKNSEVKNLFTEKPQTQTPSPAVLKIIIEEKNINHNYPVDQYLDKPTPIEGTDLSLKIVRFYTHALVENGNLINKSEEFINPAVEYEISGPQGTEHHISFSLYPDFDSMHQQEKHNYLFKSKLICEPKTQDKESGLTILVTSQNDLFYKIKSKSGGYRAGRLTVNESVATGWMDLKFKVSEFIPDAIFNKRVAESPADPKMTENTPAIHLIVKDLETQAKDEAWLQRGSQNCFHVGKRHMDIAYDYKKMPLGFQIKLKDFKISYYQGSNQPMSYESMVQLIDPDEKIDREVRIYMNNPLAHNGYKLFQSSYHIGDENEPETSIFSVNHDPGIRFIYGGSIIMVMGIYLLFFSNAFKKKIVVSAALLLFCCLASQGLAQDSLNYKHLEKIAIQNGGRVKPLQTYANETSEFVTGRVRFENRDAIAHFTQWIFDIKKSLDEKTIRITYHPLLKDLGLDLERKYYSINELTQNEKVQKLIDKTLQKEQQGGDLTPYEKKVMTLYQQITLLHDIFSGDSLTLVPDPKDMDAKWSSLKQLSQNDSNSTEELKVSLVAVKTAYEKNDPASFESSTEKLAELLRSIAPNSYPSHRLIRLELFYNKFKPFQKAWIFYLLAFLISLFVIRKSGTFLYFIPYVCGFIFHTLGLTLRVLISGRAPVSNMYESLIFLVWGTCIIALIAQCSPSLSKTGNIKKIIGSVSSLIGFLILVIAALLPIDSSIAQLVPVLRSNYWLTIHVLTIMMSYSAFALAMGIGHFNLGLYFFRPSQTALFSSMSNFLYRVLQVGVMFLVAGTILGGVWANESWGRFWGWDPKETWALISILGYLAMIHAKHAGWVMDFGLAVSAITGFALILMTYYGVNFILASGLHSYGFGSGGAPYVIGYLVFETAVIAAAIMRKSKHS